MASAKKIRKAWKHSKYNASVHDLAQQLPKSPDWSRRAVEIRKMAEEIHPTNPIAVAKVLAYKWFPPPEINNIRWIGAYVRKVDAPSALREAIEFELTNRFYEVSFAVQHGMTPVGMARIGLIVDIQKSERVRYYNGDVFSHINPDTGVRKPNSELEKDVPLDLAIKLYLRNNDYLEGIGILSYCGIVCSRKVSKNMRNVVIEIAYKNGWEVKWI